jgi:uncharacterized protein YdeI (YjbR/CyaY-like superfamily)
MKTYEIDQYIEKSAPLAQPVLNHFRELVHQVCPEVEEKLLGERAEKAMGHFGRIRSLEDLPSDDILLAYLLEAKRLNDQGVKVTPKKPSVKEKKELAVPFDLQEALNKSLAAQVFFDKFPYSQRKEYIQWIADAKTDATREKRIATTVEWVTEGKSRNWKYKSQ